MSQQTGSGNELDAQAQQYRQGAPRPLGGYVLVMTIFATNYPGRSAKTP